MKNGADKLCVVGVDMASPGGDCTGVIQVRAEGGGLVVTGCEEVKSPEAIRQAAHRAKLEALGIKEVTLLLGPVEVERLEAARRERGGVDGPYSVREYLATLLRRDAERLEVQREQLEGRFCDNCQKPLPRGCGGTWGEEFGCLRSQADKFLSL